jgi:uracil phosphoribosyltransferase
MAWEISKTLDFRAREVTTPLGTATLKTLREQPLMATVLRAGLPMMEGFQHVFDEADCAFMGAFRKEDRTVEIEIEAGYLATPSLEGRTFIMVDPMLATGKSFVKGLELFLNYGRPSRVIIAAVVAAPEGISYLEKHSPVPLDIFVAALDQGLNEHSYIVPGLGDAGDLCFGPKL